MTVTLSPEPGRIPEAVELEIRVLGAIMLRENAISEVRAEGLKPNDFYIREHSRIYELALELDDEGIFPDLMMIWQRATDRNINSITMAQLANFVEVPGRLYNSFAKDYVAEIKKKSIARKAIANANNLISKASDPNTDLVELAKKQAEELAKLSNKVTDPATKLKLDIQLLIKEADPIRKLQRKSEICSFYRIRGKDLEDLVRQIERSQSTKEVKAYSFTELLQLETEALNWLIPELLPVGETIILSAAPKAGKTLLAIDAAFAIATGEGDFLGEKVKQGKVLLVEADESLSSTRAKLLKRGFREGDNISILPSWNISQLDKLESMLEDFRPDLVIIDSLRRIHHGCTISENSAEFADSIYTLKELLGRYKASGILIHHSNKDKEAMGVGKLRGSSAIAGAVWGTWQLDHIPVSDPNTKKLIIDPKDPRRILSVFARDTEGQTVQIELDLENNSWIKQQAEEEAETKSFRDRILKVLEKNNHLPGLSGREIIQLLGEEGKGAYTILNRMVNKKLINCHPAPGDKRVNLYSLFKEDVTVDFRDTPPPPPTVPNVDYYAESYTEQRLENSQQNSQHPSKNSQHLEIENTLVDFLNLDSETVSEIVNTSDAQGGGVCVPCASSDTLKEEKTARVTGLSVANEVANEPEAIATETKSPSIYVGDTVRIKKTGEIGIATKYQAFAKAFNVKVAEVEELFYTEELEKA